jgi:hypothetical protein
MLSFLHSLFRTTRSAKIERCGDTHCKVYGIEYRPLYKSLSHLPGVVLPRKPHYFWTGAGVYAEFVLNGHTFQIEGDPWDDGLWVAPKDEKEHSAELQTIREHLERDGGRS